MRRIGTIEDGKQAERFAGYLATRGISCSVDAGTSGHVIWIHEEDRVEQAREDLADFRSAPDDERFRSAATRAQVAAGRPPRPAAATRQRVVNLRDRWSQPTIDQGPATFALMALTVLVAVMTGLEPLKHHYFTDRLVISTDRRLSDFLAGEYWRLLTPIFLHNGIPHFLFNMLMLRNFGLLIESRFGTPKFLGMVLIIAIVSNYAQFAISGPFLGGMSGVVYGLFGFIWLRGRLDPECGVGATQQTVTIMIGWQIMCFAFIPNIANWAHCAGLAAGAAMGAGNPLLRKLFQR